MAETETVVSFSPDQAFWNLPEKIQDMCRVFVLPWVRCSRDRGSDLSVFYGQCLHELGVDWTPDQLIEVLSYLYRTVYGQSQLFDPVEGRGNIVPADGQCALEKQDEQREIEAYIRESGYKGVYLGQDAGGLLVYCVTINADRYDDQECCGPIEVELHGDPRQAHVVLMSGFHGDEPQAVTALSSYVYWEGQQLGQALGPYIVVRVVSLDAINAGTRTSRNHPSGTGTDANRIFDEAADDPIARLVRDIFEKLCRKLELFVSFHNDNRKKTEPEGAPIGVYLYDHCLNQAQALPSIDHGSLIENFRTRVREAGIPLFTGLDESHAQSSLGHMIEDGYTCVPADPRKYDGQIETWLTNKSASGVPPYDQIERALCLDSPGWLTSEKSEIVVRLFFECIVYPLMKIMDAERTVATN
jgi:hypothetical protein